MTTLISNYVNGNLSDAQEQAERYEHWEIREALMSRLGYTLWKATLTADWLKGRDCWQQVCDAE